MVQAGQADLIEAVDHVPDGVLVGLHQLGDHGHPVSVGRGQQHHRAPVPHRTDAAPEHDLPQLLPFLVGQSAHPDGLGHRTSSSRNGRHPHPTAAITKPADLCGQSASQSLLLAAWSA
jgi:hypothetical protein